MGVACEKLREERYVRDDGAAVCGSKRKAGLSGKPAIHIPARPACLRGKIKGEAFASGGCRGPFATQACRSRRPRSRPQQIGRAQVGTPVTNAHILCSLLIDNTKK